MSGPEFESENKVSPLDFRQGPRSGLKENTLNQRFQKPVEIRKDVVKSFDQEFANEDQDLSVRRLSAQAEELLVQAQHSYDQGHYDNVIELLFKALRTGVQDEQILFACYKLLGNSHVCLKDYDAAEESYNKAFTINPDSDILMVNYGTMEFQRSHLEKARDYYRRGVDVNPQNEKAWIGLALVHREYGDIDLSWGNLEAALEIQPVKDSAFQLLLDWGVRDGRYERVISILEEFEKQDPGALRFIEAKAKILFIWGRLKDARESVIRARAIEPSNEDLIRLEAAIANV